MFVEHYLLDASNTSMWDEAFAYEEDEVQYKVNCETPGFPKRHRLLSILVWVRTLASAVAILVILMTGMMTARAYELDIWACIISWMRNVFNTRSANAEIAVSKTADLQNLLEENGIPQYDAPTYLPEGFESIECSVDESPAKIEAYGVHCLKNHYIYFYNILFGQYPNGNAT